MNAAHCTLSPLPRPCVVFASDDPAVRQAFMADFSRRLEILLAKDAKGLWEHLATRHVHVVIVDQRIQGGAGTGILLQARERHPSARRMLITGQEGAAALIQAVNVAGVTHLSRSPWDPDELASAVYLAYEDVVNEEERAAYTERLITANQQLEFALRQHLLS